MILADTSVWIDYFRRGANAAGELASRADMLMHPFVLIEISLGSLPDRAMTLRYLRRIVQPLVAAEADVSILIETQRLFATGLSYVDAHLLASARLTEDCQLWTRDQRLAAQATRLGVAYGLS